MNLLTFVFLLLFFVVCSSQVEEVPQTDKSYPLRFKLRLAAKDDVTSQPISGKTVTLRIDEGVGDMGFSAYAHALTPLFDKLSSPLSVRLYKVYASAAHEAWAPYVPNVSGVLFGDKFKRSSENEGTGSNLTSKQVSIYYSIFRAVTTVYPESSPAYENVTLALGLNPMDTSTDMFSAAGFGNFIGSAVANEFLNDEFNQWGEWTSNGNAEYNRVPYSDYTNFEPVNSAFRLRNPTKWQPMEVSDRSGKFWVTKFSQSFWGNPRFTKTFSDVDAVRKRVGPPMASLNSQSPAFIAQANEVINSSAKLDDFKKMEAEFFYDGVQILSVANVFLANKYHWNLDDLVEWAFLISNGLFDGSSLVWNLKRRYNSVRPQSVVRFSGIYDRIEAWGGPGQGKVNMPAKDWRPYLPENASPEYPSKSSCVCAIIIEAAKKYTKSEVFGYKAVSPAGISFIEPGLTPKADVEFEFPTWKKFGDACIRAFVNGGVHFPYALHEGLDICKKVTAKVYDKAKTRFLRKH